MSLGQLSTVRAVPAAQLLVEGEVMAAMPGEDWPGLADAEEKALAERYAEEIARKFDPDSQVRAMDKEGLDLAILFPTSAMYVTAYTQMDARGETIEIRSARRSANWMPTLVHR